MMQTPSLRARFDHVDLPSIWVLAKLNHPKRSSLWIYEAKECLSQETAGVHV